MHLLYDYIVRGILLLLPLLGLFFKKIKLALLVRKNIFNSLESLKIKSKKRIWFHCASLGEFEMARPLIEKLQRENIEIFLSFFSSSGYEIRKNYPVTWVGYLPWDTKKNVEKWFSLVDPEIVVFVKYELWLNFISTAIQQKRHTLFINANFKQNHFIFKFWGKAWRRQLSEFTCIFTQSYETFDLLTGHGFKNLQISGDTRFDRVYENAVHRNSSIHSNLIYFQQNKKILILGSSWEAEEELFFQYLAENQDLLQFYKIIIAPHNIEPIHIQKIQTQFGHAVLFTEMNESNAQKDILILNTIGHLASAYALAELAIVGGAFGNGLHNILEPLSFGVPVIFGPKYHKFDEAKSSIELGFAKSFSNYSNFKSALEHFVKKEEIEREELRQNIAIFVKKQTGASIKITNKILELLTKQEH